MKTIIAALGRRQVYTLSSVVDHLPQAVAKFHDIVAEEVRILSDLVSLSFLIFHLIIPYAGIRMLGYYRLWE